MSISDGSSTDYYKLPLGATDIIDLIEYRNMTFGQGNIFKAVYRLGEKHGIDAAYDYRKIIFFAQRGLDHALAVPVVPPPLEPVIGWPEHPAFPGPSIEPVKGWPYSAIPPRQPIDPPEYHEWKTDHL